MMEAAGVVGNMTQFFIKTLRLDHSIKNVQKMSLLFGILSIMSKAILLLINQSIDPQV